VNAARAIQYAFALQKKEPVSVPWMVEKFGISLAQAKRDLVELECLLPVRREKRDNRRSVLVMI
jgi:hypothetical protein